MATITKPYKLLSTKEIKERVLSLISKGRIEYVSSFSIKYGIKYKHPMYVIRIGDNFTSETTANSKKQIFEILSIHKRKDSEVVVLKDICSTTYPSFTKPYTTQSYIKVSDIIKELTTEEIKHLFLKNHIVKYAEILKINFSKKEISEAEEKVKVVNPIIEEKIKVVNPIIEEKHMYKKETKMKSDKIENILSTNTESAKTASAIAAGKTINKVVMDKLRPQLPMMIRGYADSPLADVIVANLAVFAAQNFATENNKANWIAEAMLTAAMTEFMTSFNLEGILKEVLETAQVEVPEEY